MLSSQREIARRLLFRFSRGSGSVEAAAPGLRNQDDVRTKLDALRQGLAIIREQTQPVLESATGPDPSTPSLTREGHESIVATAESGLTRLVNEGESASLSPEEVQGIEAVQVTDGSRPSLIVQGDDIDLTQPWNAATVGSWRVDLQARRKSIRNALRSVGLIEAVDGGSRTAVGTAFVIAPGLVLTNKHVLQAIAFRDNGRWQFEGAVEIDFVREHQSNRQNRFQVTEISFASTDAIGDDIDQPPRKLDAAILRISGDHEMPTPLRILADDTGLLHGAETYVVGYPVTRDGSLAADEVARTFGAAVYGIKRLSPGHVLDGPSTFRDGNSPSRVFTHDCSTLGGSSGSGAFEMFEGGRYAIGLHFGGLKATRANYAHALQRLRSTLEAAGATFVTPGG